MIIQLRRFNFKFLFKRSNYIFKLRNIKLELFNSIDCNRSKLSSDKPNVNKSQQTTYQSELDHNEIKDSLIIGSYTAQRQSTKS